MTDVPVRSPKTLPPAIRSLNPLLARLQAAWRRRLLRQQDVAARPHGLPLDDAAPWREEALRHAEQRRLHRIAEWSRLRGRGL